ncbi:MAG: cytochrome c oxidase subunit II [Longimicrobiales bacterium]
MRVYVYEKAFLWAGAVVLVVFMGALLYASTAMGINLPGAEERVDPATVASLPPFDSPGVRQVGEGRYEVVMIGRAWQFTPDEIRVPAGSEVTFIATATDVIHGIHVEDTRINMMLVPGQIARNSYTFREPGEHLMVCHEFCGAGHHLMYGTVVVE